MLHKDIKKHFEEQSFIYDTELLSHQDLVRYESYKSLYSPYYHYRTVHEILLLLVDG